MSSEPADPPDPSNRSRVEIHADIDVERAQDSQITGVSISQVQGDVYTGLSAGDIAALMDKLRAEFQPGPFRGECPYRGLKPFEEENADFFFGREGLVAEIVDKVKHGPALLVAGPSGSGKSSLVRAGVLPILKKNALPGSGGWIYATLTPGRAPLEALGRALSTLSGSLAPLDDFRSAGKRDLSLLSHWTEVLLGERRGRRLFLFVDQFEEVFTHLSQKEEDQRQAFIHQLTQAVNAPEGRLTLLLTLRSDFISACAAYPELNAIFNRGFIQVGAMSPEELVSAILRPALRAGLSIEPALAHQVVLDMRGQPGSLPLLQFALQDLFDVQITQGKRTKMTLEGYLARGGLGQALQRYADEAFGQLSAQEQEIARAIFRGLIIPGRREQDTRRTALFGELVPAGMEASQIEAVIRKLADARLITTAEAPTQEPEELGQDSRTATLAHERLLDAWPWLRKLVDEDRAIIELKNEIEEDARRWDDNRRDSSYLYAGARLANAQARLAEQRLILTGLAEVFLASGATQAQVMELARRQERKTELRKNRLVLLAVMLGMALLLLVGWAGYRAWYLSRAARMGATLPFGVSTATLGEQDSELAWVSSSVQVRLPPFEMEVHEVTNVQYCWCRRAGGCASDPAYAAAQVCDPDIALEPVSNITLAQADQYCRWLGRRLPMEIEWEWAARGPEDRIYPAGDDPPLPGQVNLWDPQGEAGGKWPVDRPSADRTPEGLFGMAGNVREWTLSLWLDYGHPAYLQTFWPDQVVESEGFYIARGGSFKTGPDSARSLSRYRIMPGEHLSDLGFRCVRGWDLPALRDEMRVIP